MAIVGILYHPRRDNARKMALELEQWLLSRGHESLDISDEVASVRMLDLIVSLGGDGTMLRAIDRVTSSRTPVLGVNFGSLGYLTQVDPGHLFVALERFFADDYLLEDRMTLIVRVINSGNQESVANNRSGTEKWESSFVALNEVVVEKLSSGNVIRVDVAIGSTEFLIYEADGLIVSTPTGSTAYSFSARGPVVSPHLRAMVLTPISPHMLFDRSLVLDPTEVIRLTLVDGPPAAVMVDGVQRAKINPGDVVECSANPVPASLVTFNKRDFHQIMKLKFGLSSKRMGNQA